MKNIHRYTEEELKFLADNVEGISLEELTARFNKRFNLNVSKCSIARVKCAHGLKSKYHIWVNPNNHKYTAEQDEFIRQNVKGISQQELTDKFNQKFNTTLSKYAIIGRKNKLNLKSGVNLSQFKKGQNKRALPVGTTLLRQRGHVIKVAMPNVWRLYHHVLYEQYHNVKLEKGDSIIFLDNDKTNFSKNNLMKLDKKSKNQLFTLKRVYSNPPADINKILINIAKIRAIICDIENI